MTYRMDLVLRGRRTWRTLTFVCLYAQGRDDRVWDIVAREIRHVGEIRSGDRYTSISALEKLIRKKTAIRIDQCWRKAGSLFGCEVCGDGGVGWTSNEEISRYQQTGLERLFP